MRSALREIVEAVTRHRVRTIATAFGVFWGIFMLALLLGGGEGMRRGFLNLFGESSANMVWIEAGTSTQSFQGLGVGREISIDVTDLKAVEKAVPEIYDLSPRQQLPNSTVVARGSRRMTPPTYGVYASFAKVELLTMVRGRLLNDLDVERARRVAMIGTRARSLLFDQDDPVGQKITISGVEFTVVGEFEDGGGDEQRRRVYIPHSALLRAFDGSTRVQLMVGLLRADADPDKARASVMRVISRRHRFSPTDHGALEVFFMAEEFKRLQKLLRGMDAALLVVGLGTLLSGMVGVSNILFVSVRERAREFGVRRALGATARSILMMVIAEALLLATAAGGLGLLVALGVLRLLRSIEVESAFFRDPQVDGGAIAGALGALVVTALLAGYFPAREAARMTPIEALRRE